MGSPRSCGALGAARSSLSFRQSSPLQKRVLLLTLFHALVLLLGYYHPSLRADVLLFSLQVIALVGG
jgi:hypothetical protein